MSDKTDLAPLEKHEPEAEKPEAAVAPNDEPASDEQIPPEETTDEELSIAGLHVDDEVWVAAAVVGDANPVTSMVRRKILAIEGARIRVENGKVKGSPLIRASRAFKTYGVLVITVGDFDSEWSLLDPLSTSVCEFLRLLLDPASVKLVKVRGLEELKRAWRKMSGDTSHVVFLGHGDENGLFFGGDDYELPGDELAEALMPNAEDASKTFIFLSCKAGIAEFAKKFSAVAHVAAVIGPLRAVHGAEAALFAQAFFTEHFLKGGTPAVAFNRVNKMPSLLACRFRIWKKGTLVGTA